MTTREMASEEKQIEALEHLEDLLEEVFHAAARLYIPTTVRESQREAVSNVGDLLLLAKKPVTDRLNLFYASEVRERRGR